MSNSGLTMSHLKTKPICFLKRVVFNAARVGNLCRMKKYLKNTPKEEVADIVSVYTNGATPLIIACRNGHLDVVLYLIEKCHVDIEKKGSIAFDGPPVNEASPLFHAAFAGQLNVVKVLIKYKASVNRITKTSSTSLQAACFFGHFEIVKYLIQHGADIEIANRNCQTCLMLACYKGHNETAKYLVVCGANVNRKCDEGDTALHACAETGNLHLLKYLIQHGADIEIANKHGYTCLMFACYNRQYEIVKCLVEYEANVNKKCLKGNTALHDCVTSGSLDILKFLLASGAKFKSNSYGITPLLSAAIIGHATIVDYFIQELDCTKMDKINALEILGATLIDKRDIIMAFDCWKKAMHLRYDDIQCPLEKPTVQSPIASYIGATEVRTFLQLEEIISNPYEITEQAFLVRERILGPDHPDTLYNIKEIADTYAINGNCDRSINLWMYALDAQHTVEKPFSHVTQTTLSELVDLFSWFMSEAWKFAKRDPIVTFRDILQVFERVLTEIQTVLTLSLAQQHDLMDTDQFYTAIMMIMHLISLMCQLQPHLGKREKLELEKAVYRLVQMKPRMRKGWTLLHLACFKESSTIGKYAVCHFPSSEIVNLLLKVGACPNALDLGNNTPLHIAAMDKPCAWAVFKLLLNHGSHLDVRNLENQTPLQLAQQSLVLDIYPLQYINLQCFCAQAVQSYKIPYKGFINKSLEEFVDVH